MRRLSILVLVGLVAILSMHSAYADDIKENMTDTDNMLRIIETLSSKARGVNDLERTYAKDFVKNEFQKVGLEVEEQCFEASPMSGEDIKYEGVNIIGKMLPDKQNDSGKVFIVCAHYDGVDGMPAANDNASGVSVMIELARKLRGYTTDTEIRFIAFDAEEVGMVGSKFYIDTCSDIKNIVGVLNFDYLAGKKEEKVKIYSGNGQENYLSDILKDSIQFSNIEIYEQTQLGSDHIPFALKAIPNLMFSHEVIDSEYHNKQDIIENISVEMLRFAVEAGEQICFKIMGDNNEIYTDKNTHSSKPYLIQDKSKIMITDDICELSNNISSPVIQIPSIDNNMKYIVKVKLFDFDEILDMVVTVPILSKFYTPEYYIDIDNESIPNEELVGVLDKYFVKISENKWANIYGNEYSIEHSIEHKENTIRLFIRPLPIGEQEGYVVKNGNLIRMENASPFVNVIFYMENGNIKYDIDKINKESEKSNVSQNAQNCWDKIKGIVGDIDTICFISILTDGIGGENGGIKISKHNSLTQQIESFIHSKEMPDLTEFKQLEKGFFDGEGINLSIDYLDVLHIDGKCYGESNLKKEWSIAKILCQDEQDKPSDWAVDSVISAIETEIIPFELLGKYEEDITRLEFCKIIYNLMDNMGIQFEKSQNDTAHFIDIECDEVRLLYDIGALKGIDGIHFKPQDKITREQAATILNRICRYMGLNANNSSTFMYSDHSLIHDYAVSSVYAMREFEVMFGTEDNLFSPQTQLTREQAITTIVRLKNVLEGY